MTARPTPGPAPRRVIAHAAIAAVWIAAIVALAALGTWQVHRRHWKLDLIARVEARIHAPPVPAPRSAGPDDAYRRVAATGAFLPRRDSFVQAVTDHGPGWWVLTPLRLVDGRVVLIDRGYVPDRRAPPPPARATVTGLLRLTEPGGGFLQRNDPAADRWYSRDVAAIAARRGLAKTVGYFIDADDARSAPGDPVGGLTVVDFPNNHLVYAITWYVLATMAAAGFGYWIVLTRGRRRP